MRFGLAGTIAYYDGLRSLLNTDMPIDRAVTLAGERGAQPYRAGPRPSAPPVRTATTWRDGLRHAGEDAFIVALIETGETSSRLPMCQEIVDIHRHALLLRNEIISRSIYPVIFLHAATMIPAVPPIFLGRPTRSAYSMAPWQFGRWLVGYVLQRLTRNSLGARMIICQA